MTSLEQELMRKIEIRQLAKENLGLENDSTTAALNQSGHPTAIDSLMWAQLEENLKEADWSKHQDGYWPLSSTRFLGKFIVLCKKVMRKLLKVFWGWYIFPIYQRQSHFNGKILNAVNLTRDAIKQAEAYQNQQAEVLQSQQAETLRLLQAQVDSLTRQLAELKSEALDRVSTKNTAIELRVEQVEEKLGYTMGQLNLPDELSLLELAPPMDYFDFENQFRGPRSAIKESQKPYVEYFKINGGGPILDAGCGRGEFLELMFDHGMTAYGVDIYEPFVEYCSNRGFVAQKTDILSHLNSLEDTSLGGIFMSQVVEHLNTEYLRAVISVAYRKLKPGCYFILETPNAETLVTYRNFYLDAGHAKPVHFLTLKYYFETCQYESIERFQNDFSRYPHTLPELQGDQIKNLQEFNEGICNTNEVLFGLRDYTLIARK